MQAMRVLKPGGLLMTCSCSGAVTLDDHLLPVLKVGPSVSVCACVCIRGHRF